MQNTQLDWFPLYIVLVQRNQEKNLFFTYDQKEELNKKREWQEATKLVRNTEEKVEQVRQSNYRKTQVKNILFWGFIIFERTVMLFPG